MKLEFDEDLGPERAKKALEEILISRCMQMGNYAREEAIERIRKSNQEYRERMLNQNIAENWP